MEPRRSGYGQLTPTTHHDTYPYIDPSQYNMTGRVIFISGATKGIGRAAALSFAKAGVSGIVIAGRSVDLLHTLEAEIIMTCKHYKRPAVKVLRAMIDICDSLTIESAMAKTREVFGHIDILVNSAATVDQPVPISASNSGDWSFTLDTNVTGTYHLIKAALLLMNQDSNAPPQMIINLVSAIINMPTSRSSAYTISKLALLRMTEMFQTDLEDTPVCVVGLHPGFVLTDATKELSEDIQAYLIDSPMLAADTMVWLARDRRPWLNGRYISCNWDMGELQKMKEEIVAQDKMKFKMLL
ncbi:hypothetical protein HHX47_DHR8000001 [Lentinula edodes]|nr:hypothetical protein HHX47_DHR8000001 [Lentinula edodes]